MKPPAIRLAPGTHTRRCVRQLDRISTSMAGPITGFTLLLLIWQILALFIETIPDPGSTLQTALALFGNPFPDPATGQTGLGWNILITLERLFTGLALALLAGFPAGVLLGRLPWLTNVCTPVINLFRHVSPLAWLPFGLLVFNAPESAAVWTIFVCSVWPLLNNTAEGIRRVPRDYLNLARTLALPEWKVFTRIILPAAAPHIVTGLRMSVSGAWLVVVASEMFIGGEGIGSWLRTALANLNSEKIVIAILLVGTIGLLLDLPLLVLRKRLTPKN